jgi:mono/diheme cytochrome c family protein
MKLRSVLVLITVVTSIAITAFAFQSRSVRDGVYTDAQSQRGREAFSQNCAMCHNEDLSGGEVAPALFGGTFMSNWNGLTVGDLFERIRLSMPPDNSDKINAQQRSDIISLILKANAFPAGAKELESKVEFLKEIKIEPKQ